MNRTETPKRYPLVRVANFTRVPVPNQAVIGLGPGTEEELVAQVRRHADLPYVYVLSPDRAAVAAGLLGRLKSVRSPCYPYAVFVPRAGAQFPEDPDVQVFEDVPEEPAALSAEIDRYAQSRFVFDRARLEYRNPAPLPSTADVLIVGAGITGLYAATRLREKGLSVCLVEKRGFVGGIWSMYANASSKVNTSEPAYRLREPGPRSNRDHSSATEILEDLNHLAEQVSPQLFTQACVERIERLDRGYRVAITRNGQTSRVSARGVIVAINDRVGTPRSIAWENQESFRGTLASGISDEASKIDWLDKSVVIIGMGAFAVENARTALENGARQVTVVCRRHGTVCPKIIDYLNFATPYNERLEHDRKSNIRNMMLWKKLYDLSRATQPECWMSKIKHEGHTISVSDIWFVAHYLKRLSTLRGTVSGMFERGIMVEDRRIEADIVVNCVGFHRNTSAVKALCGYTETYNTNYLDKDLMYLADAYIDDSAHNSFFGSSVLEMVKFYLEVYLDLFDNPAYEQALRAPGIEAVPLDDRKWSHYIAGAHALIGAYPRFGEIARAQIDRRTANFLESYDLESYIAANRREWVDTHRRLAGEQLAEADCLPFVFDRLIESKG